MRESDIQRQILDYLALKGIFAYRNNSGAFDNGHGGFYRFGAVGSPDIICVIDGQYVGIEVKAARGRQSEHQKEFQKKLEAAGGKYILAYSLDDFLERIAAIS
jgi:Holliday junction resolvase